MVGEASGGEVAGVWGFGRKFQGHRPDKPYLTRPPTHLHQFQIPQSR